LISSLVPSDRAQGSGSRSLVGPSSYPESCVFRCTSTVRRAARHPPPPPTQRRRDLARNGSMTKHRGPDGHGRGQRSGRSGKVREPGLPQRPYLAWQPQLAPHPAQRRAMQVGAQIVDPHRLADHSLVHEVALAWVGQVVAALLGPVQAQRQLDHSRGGPDQLLQRVRHGVGPAILVQHPYLRHTPIITQLARSPPRAADQLLPGETPSLGALGDATPPSLNMASSTLRNLPSGTDAKISMPGGKVPRAAHWGARIAAAAGS